MDVWCVPEMKTEMVERMAPVGRPRKTWQNTLSTSDRNGDP